jgi:hypothetical protein
MSETPNHNHDRSGRFTANNKYKFRPSDAPPDSDPSRDKLRVALQRHREEQLRCDALEAARERCHGELRESWRAARDSENKLKELQDANHAPDLAYAYANNEAPTHNPAITIAQSETSRHQRETARLTEIETALDSEIEQSQRRLGYLRGTLRDCINEAVCSDPAFQSLLDELDRTHAHLRGLHKCFRVISKAVGGLPHEHFTHVHRIISLDPDVAEPIELGPALSWELALVKLRDNADAPLPSGGGFAAPPPSGGFE